MSDTSNETSAAPGFRRKIRSFVKREGRLTPGQQHAIERNWPGHGVEYTGNPLDLPALFGNENPVVLEIGFGMGYSLAQMAAASPEINFLGIEVHKPGVGALLMEIEKQGLGNIRVMNHDAVEILENSIADEALHRVQVYFPDPWPKKRHHKRRLIQPEFVRLLVSKLAPGGQLHLATDWQPYAEHMLEVLQQEPGLVNTVATGYLPGRPEFRPKTKFEQRGERLGHGVWDLLFEKPGS